ncbi:MAG TPA: 23S rRNA (adenine(2503)-C(2))-methyltransferase RlmN [Terriglobia bacterium]|nr:23S rRNA (adenine(2503)-C(2))-methyltransferase RlmN [Terriglobia bacterium]
MCCFEKASGDTEPTEKKTTTPAPVVKAPLRQESMQGNLFGLDKTELEQLAVECGQPRYRGKQLFRNLYSRRARDLDTCTDIPADFRQELMARRSVEWPEIKARIPSRDGAVRYLFALGDGESIETVYMPIENRVTLCLSSQVGCAVGCRFCFTALLGVKRNLSAGEIAGQVAAVLDAQRPPAETPVNLVFMGMGEPMLNLEAVMKAVGIFSDSNGFALALRRMTVSTAGVIPQIRKFAQETTRPKLAISLNASSDEQRTALMPLNRKYPLEELLQACREFPLGPREYVTFEYVLLDGINDSDDDARRVAALVRGIKCKLNLIPFNPGPELPYQPSPLKRVLGFQDVLRSHDVPAYIRISRGQDVMAACGQLRLGAMMQASAPIEARL